MVKDVVWVVLALDPLEERIESLVYVMELGTEWIREHIGIRVVDVTALVAGIRASCRWTCTSAEYENGGPAAKRRSTCSSLLELSGRGERGQSEFEQQAGESIA